MKTLIPCLVSVVALLSAVPARPADTETTPQEIENLAKGLVPKLGEPDFRKREAASRELAKLGLGALKAINEGCRSPDPEIRARCLALIPKIRALDLKRRLDELAVDTEGRIANTLPLGATYESICGKDQNARKFYIEMCKNHYKMLDTAAANPKATGEAYFDLSIAMQDRTIEGFPGGGSTAPVTALQILAMLLIGSDDKIGPAIDEAMRKQPNPGYQPLSKVFWQPQFQTAFIDPETGPMFRKVMFVWIKRRNDPTNATQTAVVSAIQQISQQQAGRFVADKETIEFVLDTAVTPNQQP